MIEPHLHTERSMHEYIHEPYWRVVLSDDRSVYSHHNRRSWLELRSYLEQNPSIYIEGLWFGFRDHLEEICVGKADYFFVHSMLAEYGGSIQYFFIGGYRKDDLVYCKKFRIPEIYFVEEAYRELDDLSVQRGLISHVKSYLSE